MFSLEEKYGRQEARQIVQMVMSAPKWSGYGVQKRVEQLQEYCLGRGNGLVFPTIGRKYGESGYVRTCVRTMMFDCRVLERIQIGKAQKKSYTWNVYRAKQDNEDGEQLP
jgi:hypothetical protein